MPASPLVEDSFLVRYTITVGGSPLKDEYGVLDIIMDQAVNKISTAKVEILLERGGETNEAFEPSEEKSFAPGSEISIKLGYMDTLEPAFEGLIIRHGIRSGPDGRAVLILHCVDKAIKLSLGQKTASYKKQKDSVIISSIISAAGLTAEVEATDYEYKQLFQYQQIDWDFILNRAEANGMIVYTDAGKVFVKKPLDSGSAILLLTYGKDVYTFNTEIDARYQLSSVKASGWDPTTQAFLEGSSQEPSVSKQGDLAGKKLAKVVGLSELTPQFSAPLESNELKALANGMLIRSRLSANRGKISFTGSTKAKLNTLIELVGFGARFNGLALITAVHHRVIEGEWRTEVTYGLSPEWYYQQRKLLAEGGSLFSSIKGLQNGLVTKIDADPDGEHRIEVDVPVSGDKIWARLSGFYANADSGVFFMPEVGDEVVLGFIGNDPRFAVILGSLYSKKNKPPHTADAENSIKTILTKAKIKIELNDKDKVLTLETPGKNSVVISDKDKSITLEDQHGNKIEMASAGITIKSAKDIILDATANVTIKAGQAVSVQASGGDVKLKGLNVTAQGEIGATVKGGATAELSAGGNTTVKGAIVMIN